MTEIEIGRAKRGRRAYSFDDIAIVPSRRTRDPEEVSVAWQIDAYRFEIPVVAAPMDSVMSPATAIALGKHGGLGVVDLEGLWTRYDDPEPLLEEVAALRGREATRRLQQIYAEPVRPERRYLYIIERGPVALAEAAGADDLAVSGRTLLDMAANDFSRAETLVQAKLLLRALINHYLGGRELVSRRVLKELQEL